MCGQILMFFTSNEDGSPTVIAGVPPDYFSETGQRWGNPLYRWDVMLAKNYAWWAARLQMCFTQADIVRIDHFRGFDAYWEIPATEETAVIGKWIKGPGVAFFQAMEEQLGTLPLIAEDLGLITPEVEALRDRFDFPGMKILQFAFGGERNSNFLPHNFGQNCVVYTGTHDNETVIGWYQNASDDERDHVRRYMGIDGSEIAWDMIRLAYASVANTAVATLQDLMELDNVARMNFPGTPERQLAVALHARHAHRRNCAPPAGHHGIIRPYPVRKQLEQLRPCDKSPLSALVRFRFVSGTNAACANWERMCCVKPGSTAGSTSNRSCFRQQYAQR